MNENKPVLLAQANALTQARYDFNPIEKRCLYQIIREVRRLFIDSNTGQRDLFNNMRVTLTSEQLAECSDKSNIKKVYESLKKLRKRDVEIDNEEIWMNTGYVTMVKHHKRTDKYEVEVSSEIMPYLVALAENFTSYDLTVAITLKSSYSQRFYEYCCQYKNRANKTFFFSVEQLKNMLMLEDKYPNSADFKAKVLEVARKELKDAYDRGQCDLYFDYQVKDKQGRKILSWFFFIHTKEEENTTDYKTVAECLQRINNILIAFFSRDKKYIKRVITAVQLRPDIALELVEKMDKKVLDYSRKEVAPIIRYVLREDYNII
jgi:plasmid replication initiation protein